MRSSEASKPCQMVTLACGPLLRMERCSDCGTITLHLGAVSLRLDRSAAESVWTTLGQGLGTPSEEARTELAERTRFAQA
jgi:hypothetical protein